jgi:hypothetical protein
MATEGLEKFPLSLSVSRSEVMLPGKQKYQTKRIQNFCCVLFYLLLFHPLCP